MIGKTIRDNINLNEYQPGSLIIFLDKNTKEPPDYTGCNQKGILLEKNRVLFCRGKKLIETDINKIKPSKAVLYPFMSEELSLKVFRYFNSNKTNFHLFNLGVQAIASGKEKIIETPNIMPKFNKRLTTEEYEKAWDNLIEKLQKGDMIATFNEKSFLSKLIAKLDKGSWSHVATYIGNGEICEAVVKLGVVKRSINVYKNKNIHLGVYRPFDITADQQEKIVSFMLSKIGVKYNYIGAIRLGLKILLGIKTKILTPNGFVYSGSAYLVDYL